MSMDSLDMAVRAVKALNLDESIGSYSSLCGELPQPHSDFRSQKSDYQQQHQQEQQRISYQQLQVENDKDAAPNNTVRQQWLRSVPRLTSQSKLKQGGSTAWLDVNDELLGCHDSVADIIDNCAKRVAFTHVRPREALLRHPGISTNDRAILVNWLVEVHFTLQLNPSVLFLACTLIDRYLQHGPMVSLKNLQLLGITALHVASKFEEVHAPPMRNYLHECDGKFNREQLMAAEKSFLEAITFTIAVPTVFHFLMWRLRLTGLQSKKLVLMCTFLAELALLDEALLEYPPSIIAQAAVSIACEKFDPAAWETGLALKVIASGDREELYPCLDRLLLLAWSPQSCGMQKLRAVRRKYSQPSLLGVASLFSPATGLKGTVGLLDASEECTP
jgi:hypothetical protein